MRIALTGGTGFLGRYLIRQLARSGHRLCCWHRPTSDRTALEDVTGAVEWVPGTLTDPATMQPLVSGADALVHAALEWSGVGGFRSGGSEDLLGFLRANLMGSLELFAAARAAGVGRCVFIGTCAVHEVILDDRALDEAHPLWPTSHYGAHKAALEKFVHSLGLGEGWPICSLRPTGIYGLAHPARASKWYDLVGRVLAGEAVSSARGGKEVHAADVARATEVLLNADAKAITGQAFNCFDRYVAEQDVARLAKELTGRGGEIADLNRGPKHLIETGKLRSLGMKFGGTELLRATVAQLAAAHEAGRP